MSRIISYRTSAKANLLGYLGAADRLTPHQQRTLGMIQDCARQRQAELDRQDIDLGLTIPAALDHLLAGSAESTAQYAGSAYYNALQCIICCTSSDPGELGVYSKPSTFFSLLDEELLRVGVSAELLFRDRLFSGPPREIPFHVPSPVDGPYIGMFPLELAKPAADAYREALDKVEQGFRYDLLLLVEMLELEHEDWDEVTRDEEMYQYDTLYFDIVG